MPPPPPLQLQLCRAQTERPERRAERTSGAPTHTHTLYLAQMHRSRCKGAFVRGQRPPFGAAPRGQSSMMSPSGDIIDHRPRQSHGDDGRASGRREGGRRHSCASAASAVAPFSADAAPAWVAQIFSQLSDLVQVFKPVQLVNWTTSTNLVVQLLGSSLKAGCHRP